MQNLSSQLLRTVKHYARNDSGQFATIFALAATAIVGGMACAIDLGTVTKDRSKLQDVADAVALGAAQNGLKSAGDMRAFANAYIANHYSEAQDPAVTLDSIRKTAILTL